MAEATATFTLPGLGEGEPGCVLHPRSVEEVSEALRGAWEAGASVRPWGGGTQMVLGHAILPAPARVVDLTRLDRVVEHRPEDMTVTVQAGVRWGDLAARLGQAGHELPFDPPVLPEATVGGMTAVGLSGPRRFAYGRLRDWVLGVQVVRPDGTITRAGGRVVKNVSGYELSKVYVGSLGTLGVITEVTFKTRPVAPSRRVAAVPLPGPRALEAAVARIMDSPVEPAFLEAFWIGGRDGRKLHLETEPSASKDDGGPARLVVEALGLAADDPRINLPWLLAGFEGTEGRTAWQHQEVRRLLEPLRTAEMEPLEGAAGGRGPAALPRDLREVLFRPTDPPWEAVHEALLAGHRLPLAGATGDGRAVFYASLMSDQVAGFLAFARDVTERENARFAAYTHAGNGGVALHVAGPPPALEAAGRALLEEAARLGGSMVLRHGPPPVRQALPIWDPPPATLPLMRALKEKLDPRRILNPGRFVGGL
ncbi:FAD-binding oxidoreductase [Limnochorda pilosa]|uniref:FAD-binding PCMH-type domain-containing protein n=1 Tax=Limnochorda pilosa TaxID=1555112 RepID=A0A0K2SQD9_LIMPI|nr:FAD-binding oxidoreductase [Limnochorda pilosa]BAS29207.1 hypothetical protein LIP_3395 [Limnochorda pilosa]